MVELSGELQGLITVYRKKLHYVSKLQMQAHNKGVKPKSYTSSDKVWLNSKYIRIKQNRKLKAKFFGPFWVLNLINKQAYKLELPKKWRVHNVLYMSLLEQNTNRERQVSEKVPELNDGNKDSKKYKMEAIWNSVIYAKEVKGHLPRLYYLVPWKDYPEKRSICELGSVI